MLKRLSNNILRFTAYLLGAVLLLMTAFHFWFINHAEQLVEDMVNVQSDGKLRLKVDKFKFNWFSYKMELRRASFYSTDTTAATSYQFSVPRIRIQVKEILPLVLEKKILIDSLQLISPDIRVTRLRSGKDTTASSDSSLSLPQEMGRIYNSIQDALKVLKVDRFQIDDGKFSLINKINPGDLPVVISDINFHLDNLQVDTTQPETQEKILFSDNVALLTRNQDILFPDGRHRLSFRTFRINIHNKIVEFDSCTVMASRDDSTNNSFQVFFDKLQMTNIDFSTLYHREIIKADSVYCINPQFRLDVTLDKNALQKPPPRLDELVRQLTGNMQLAFVVVENGSFDINTTKAGRLSSFTSEKNNFELQGLEINKYGQKPLTVKKFVMAIRNYENFLRDSAYSMQFDSILINDNRISLSNFKYQELENGKMVNNLSMPQFELQGLSWDDLVFNQQLSAQKVNLYRPVINYTVTPKKYDPKDVFQTLAGVGNFMQLEHLTINDGQVNLFFENNIQLNLQNADISVLGKRLVGSRKLHNIQNSVNSLHFKKGLFKMRNLTADLNDVSFLGTAGNSLHAGTIHIQNHNAADITAKGVTIQSMTIRDDTQQPAISGIRWQQAVIRLFSLPQPAKDTSARLVLKDIAGENTSLYVQDSLYRFSVLLGSIAAGELVTGGQVPQLTNLSATGNDLRWSDNKRQLQIKSFEFTDLHPSVFHDIQYRHYQKEDSITASIPQLEIDPDINRLLNGSLLAGRLYISSPALQFHSSKPVEAVAIADIRWPKTRIGQLIVEDPVIDYKRSKEEGTARLSWQGKGNRMQLTDLVIDNEPFNSVSAKSLQLSLHKFLFQAAKGRTLDAGPGHLEIALNKLKLQHNEAGAWDWSALIVHLKTGDFVIDSLGKKSGRLTIDNARLENLFISSANLLNPREILRSNSAFRLFEFTGGYFNDKNRYNWYNTAYDKQSRLFTADSFVFCPTMERDSFIAATPYQTDFITARTGTVTIGPLDIDRFAKDSVLAMGTVTINDGVLTDYRDKRKPRQPGIVRSLPASLLKKIPFRVVADSMKISSAFVTYEEVNERTGATGKMIVAKLEGSASHIRNFDLSPNDSLQVNASGYLENKLFTSLQVKESYTDPLGGFLMSVKMDSADLTVFNRVLKPLISAELKSGYLDSMNMQVSGREAFASGTMKMIYRDLKIRVTGSREKKQVFGSGIKSFLANTLVKNKNTKRTGTVYFQRLRDRSAINYLVKITLSGVSSSIGVKKSDRLARKNRKQINQPLSASPLP